MFFSRKVEKLLQEGYGKGKAYNYEGIVFILTLEHLDPSRNDLSGFKWKIQVFHKIFYLPIGRNVLYPSRAQWIYEQLEKIHPNNEKNYSLAIFIDRITMDVIESLTN